MVYTAASVSSVSLYLLGCPLSHRDWPFTSHGRDDIVSGAHGSRLDVVERLGVSLRIGRAAATTV